MGKNFKEVVAEIKTTYDIVDYVSQSVKLKKIGMHKWRGVCPFHNEKTPSFYLDQHFQNFKCFGCGVSGDILTFVEKTESLEFFESVKMLAEEKNIELDVDDSKSGIDYQSLRSVLKETANFFYSEYRKLPESHPARQQVLSRKLSENKMLYGYAPEGRQTLYNFLKNKGFTDEIILQAGVCSKFDNQLGLYDFWNGRLMFFITNIVGQPVGFSGRKLYETDKRGKYVNSSDGPMFDKSSSLYNIQKAKNDASKESKIFITEGQFDVASLIESNINNVVASSGTAFTEKQAMICRRLVSENGKIVFCFDGDTAGLNAAKKVFENIPLIHSQSYIVVFPKELDPCSYYEEFGGEDLRKYIKENVKPIIEFIIDSIKLEFDLDEEIERSKFVDEVSKVLKTIQNKTLQSTYIKKVALASFLSVEDVKEAIKNVKDEIKNKYINKEETKVVEDLRPQDVTKNEIELIDLIEKDQLYEISARIISLTLLETNFINSLKKIQNKIPADFNIFMNELFNYSSGPIIPEFFTEEELAKKLINTNYFPLIFNMDYEDKKDLFLYLYNNLKETKNEKEMRNIKSKIFNLIKNSNNDIVFLKEAINKESEELNKI